MFALIVAFPWGIAVMRDFHSGWFVFACVITPVMVVAFVLRQLGIIPVERRQSQ